MKLAYVVILTFCLGSLFSRVDGSESALDCTTAVSIFENGVQAQPYNTLELYVDALRTNPGCRRDLLISAIRAADGDTTMIRWVIFISRQEFPNELTLLAEAAMGEAPEYGNVIREAFFVDAKDMEMELAEATTPSIPGPEGPVELTSAVASVEGYYLGSDTDVNPDASPDFQSALVELPEEAQKLDEDIREAIARMTAKVEGKIWPEQEVPATDFTYKQPDKLRVTQRPWVDEQSLDNSLPVDTIDERKMLPMAIKIDDEWKPSEDVRLDESKFTQSRSDTRMAAVARQKELAPAGSVGLPQKPSLGRSSVYYIPPAEGDYNSTIDRDDRQSRRPTLVIRSAPSSPTSLR